MNYKKLTYLFFLGILVFGFTQKQELPEGFVYVKSIIPDLITSGLPKVAVRIPDHPLTLKLLQKLDFPLSAPSANPFGYISLISAQEFVLKNQGKCEAQYCQDAA